MEMKQDLTRLRQSSSEQLGIQITGESSWAQLGADSRDHMEMLPAIGNQLQMQMPHTVGDRTNTACGPSDDLLNQAAAEKETSNIRIDAVTTNQQTAVQPTEIINEKSAIELPAVFPTNKDATNIPNIKPKRSLWQ